MHNLTCGPLAATMRTINSPLLYFCLLVSKSVGKCGIFSPKIKSEQECLFSVHIFTLIVDMYIDACICCLFHGVMGLYAWNVSYNFTSHIY